MSPADGPAQSDQNIMGAFDIAQKDLRLLIRDRRAAAILIALPLIFIAIIGVSTGQLLNLRQGGREVTVGVVDQVPADGGKDAELVEKVLQQIRSHKHFKVSEFETHDAALAALDRGRVIDVLVIGRDFPQKVKELELGDILRSTTGRLGEGPASLDLTIETKESVANLGTLGGAVIFSDVIRTIAPEVAGNSENIFVKRIMRAKASREEDASAEKEMQLVNIVQQKRRPGSIVFDTIVPSYTVLFVFFLVNIMARSFISERELGTLKRLRLAPISARDVLLGKNVPFYLLSLVQTSMLFLCGRLLFDMSWGVEPWLLVPVIACTSLAATALGLMVATFIHTDAQVSAYANSLVIILAGISGCFMPREWLPQAMQNVSLATPHAWALIAYDEILTHSSIDHEQVARCCGMLLLFSAIFFVVGWLRFRRQEG